jgi:hypothetical protein
MAMAPEVRLVISVFEAITFAIQTIVWVDYATAKAAPQTNRSNETRP